MRTSLLTISDICRLLKLSRTSVFLSRKRGLIPEPHFILCGQPRWDEERFFKELADLTSKPAPVRVSAANSAS